jgi:LuxR family maltose regulon positive regulatory protein
MGPIRRETEGAMRVPTIPAKAQIPQLPVNYVARPRLDAIWSSRIGRRVLLVTAGAGFGKTSFLAANARASAIPCAWLTLDEHDRDLATFYVHLRAAVSSGHSGAPQSVYATGPDLLRVGLADVLQLLHRQGRRILILDDVHAIREASEVCRLLTELIRYMPGEITLVLSGREPPELPTAKGRTGGAIATIGAADLAVRADEAAVLFAARFPGATIGPSLARALVSQTEGWAAGIEIFLQLLDGTSADAVRRTLIRLRKAGSGWFDYFAEEVVAHLDASTQEFLEGISVLPRLEGECCDRLLGTEGSRSRIQELVRRNLFTVPSDERGESFRIHSLFRAFLRKRLEQRMAPSRLREYLRRAARLLSEEGAHAEAAETLAEAGDLEATIRLIEQRGEELLAEGRYETVRRTFERLPEALLHDNPDALFVRARLHDFQSEWEEAEVLYRRLLRMRPPAPRRAELMSLIAQIISRRGDYPNAHAWCRRAQAIRGRVDAGSRGRILATMGVCAAAMGRLDEGAQLLQRAWDLYQRREDPDGAARIEYLQAINIDTPRGALTQARRRARRALVHFRRRRDPRRVCYSLGVLALMLVEAGDTREGRELAEETYRIAERIGLPEHLAVAHYILGRAAQMDGSPEAAGRHYERSIEVADRVGQSYLHIASRIGLARIQLALGNRHAGRVTAMEALNRARMDGDRIQEARCCTVLGQVSAVADPAEARRWWGRAERILRRCGARLYLQRLQLLMLDSATTAPRKARLLLEDLLRDPFEEDDGGAGDRDLIFRAIERERAARVLPKALVLGVEEARVAEILTAIGDGAVPHLAQLAGGPEEAIRARAVAILTRIGNPAARTVLRTIARRPSKTPSVVMAAEEVARAPEQSLRIEALGALRVHQGGEEIPADRWRSRRALRLFQYLAVHRFRWVPKEQVMEALWPDAGPGKAATSLWQAVHQLRRTLEPELQELRDSRHVRFQNEAYRIEPGDGGSFDVLEFERAVDEGEHALAQGKVVQAERSLRRAFDLYHGDLLAEYPYEEFVTEERERLRDRLIRGLSAQADALAARRRWTECAAVCGRGLERDAYHEGFHFQLVRSQIMLGNRHGALERYQQYADLMASEMGLLPSRPMKDLIESVGALPS